MRDLKNIDRLFQEKFKDFEAEPHEQVWKNIEAALKDKDEDRKIIPFWWKLAGIAAALLIGLIAWNLSNGKSQNETENSVVIGQPKTNPVQNQGAQNAVANQETKSAENKLIPNSDASATDDPDNVKSPITKRTSGAAASDHQKTNGTNAAAMENAVASGGKKPSGKASKTMKSGIPFNAESEQAVARQTRQKSKIGKRTNAFESASKTENAVASQHGNKLQGKHSRHKKVANGYNNSTDRIANVASKNSGDQNAFGASQKPGIGSSQNQETAATGKDQNNNIDHTLSPAKNPFAPTVDKTIAVKQAPAADPKLDSAAVAPVVPNALEELLQQKNEKETKIAETKLNRWQITTNVAPVYFSSTSNGSPIDQEFEGNSKSYENNLAYGLGVNYALSKKWNVRAGVNKLTLAYNTNDVVFFAGFRPQAFNNIDVASNATQLEVMNKGGETADLLPFESNIQSTNSGAINQKMGYVEVPLEVSYKLLNKKFGISFIGGVSTLFLSENEVRVVSSSMSTTLGKANNLNDVHFSTNLGLGFQYQFWRSFQFNFEPTFKYQVNTFSNDSGNFKPYFIGLYSGLSFKF